MKEGKFDKELIERLLQLLHIKDLEVENLRTHLSLYEMRYEMRRVKA